MTRTTKTIEVKPGQNTRPLVLVSDGFLPDAIAERVRGVSSRVEINNEMSPDTLAKADVIFTNQAPFDPADAPKLRWVQLNTAAIGLVVDRPIARSGIPVTNVRGAYSVDVAEFTIGMLLMLTRRLNTCHRLQIERTWPEDYDPLQGESCYGKTMGIVGYGSIGRHVARIAKAMGLSVLAYKQNIKNRRDTAPCLPNTGDPEGVLPDAWFGSGQLMQMLERSDIVVCLLPITQETQGLIGADELGAIPGGSYVLSVGRGGVIDEHALANRLKNGELTGAALDVFANEPLNSDSPLWDLPNVVMAPHIASYTSSQSRRAIDVLIDNIERDLSGRELVNIVDFRRGY